VFLGYKFAASAFEMTQIETLEALRRQYFELSQVFLLALQNDSSSEELEIIRKQIREIVAKMELLESNETTD
jgi:hypothetical protein